MGTAAFVRDEGPQRTPKKSPAGGGDALREALSLLPCWSLSFLSAFPRKLAGFVRGGGRPKGQPRACDAAEAI